MSETTEKAYSPKEMSVTLDIGDSTLRKWCIALENNGYGFIRNDQNNRLFVESDLVALRHFQNLIKTHNMQLESAAKLIVDRFGKGAFEVGTGVVLTESKEEQRDLSRSNDELASQMIEYIKGLEERMDKQEEFNKALIKRLDRQQKYIEERLEERDKRLEERDLMFLESIRASQEIKQQLLQIASAKEEKKGFWARLFGK
ncbi:DUF3967 domain-containing protein [Bacillus sp. CGMCC 1.16607]|uniref:DUF3967 domain-containing protein n=1 Tax=Bacillus sp. CGMCC 1.16607 TaxID=3351842 RepID=UPI0036279275